MTARKAKVISRVFTSLTQRHGWSVKKAGAQVRLDYHLTPDELNAALRIGAEQ